MKHLSICVFVIFFSIISISQTVYFNNRYDSETQIWNGGVSLIETSTGYIFGGTTGDPSNEQWHQISLIKINFEGSKLDEVIIGDINAERDIAVGSFNKISGGYIFTGTMRTHTLNWVHDVCMLVKIDENLDTVWTKHYGELVEPYDTAYLPRHLTINKMNHFIITGTKKPYALPSKVFILNISESGEKIWENHFGTGSYYYQGFSVIQTTDGGYAIGGYRFQIGQNETADPIIYKTDSLGNLEWEKNIGGPFDDYYPMLTLGLDGNIVAGITYADSMAQPDVAYRRINVVKLDNQGNILWNKKYGQSITYNYLKQIRTTDEGGYIASGNVKTDYPHRSGWLLRISEDGDSLWYRQYDNLLGEDSRNYLYDVIPTSDNGFAACGYVIPYPPDPGSQDAWVLKVDSMGCDTPGCATGVQVFEFPESTKLILRVWPNPAKNRFSVFSSDFLLHNEKLVRVYNSQGIKVEEVEIPEAKEPITINIEGWPKGIYFVQLLIEGETLTTKKVIVH